MNDLKYAAKEINKVLGLVPRIHCFDDQKQLELKIKAVSEYVIGDQQLFSDKTVAVVKKMSGTKVQKRRSYTSASHFIIRQRQGQRDYGNSCHIRLK